MIDISSDERVRLGGSQLVVMSVQHEEDVTHIAIEDMTEGQLYEFFVKEDSVRQKNPIVSNDVSAAEQLVLKRAGVDKLENRN